MNNKQQDALDMNAELFIPPRSEREYWIPPKSEQDYIKDLKEGAGIAVKAGAIHALVFIFRAKTRLIGHLYTQNIVDDIAQLFKQYASSTELSEIAAEKLLGEGGNCEGVGDYQGAAWFYAASLEFGAKDPEFCFFRLNNLGFCLVYLKKFKEAEKYLREATKLNPKLYNAWKNLGVCLEHQGKTEEAANCYMNAINLSRAERRSVNHLMRLISRHPELRAIPQVAGYLDSLVTNGVIGKPGTA